MSNPTSVVTERRLGEFYQEILPYLGGSADAGFTPVGSVIAIMGVTAPANYLACNGQIVNVADYPELANYFEQQFGSKYKFGGSGTTFGIPDLRGEFLRGTGTNSHTNQGSGSAVGTHQDATSIPSYGVNSSGELMAVPYSNTDNYILNHDSSYNSGTNQNKARTATMKTAWDVSGMKNRYNVRPTTTSILWCIATKDIYLNPSMDYSTSEKVVGKWIDGKTIYQKTITGTLDFTTTAYSVAFAVANLSKVIDIKAAITSGNFSTLPAVWIQSVDGQAATCFARVFYDYANSVIKFTCSSEATFHNRNFAVTIQYTKTT